MKPSIMLKLINSFATNLYGSSLWSLLSADCEKLYKAWNVMVRTVFGLDRTTHRRLIEPLSGSLHIKPALLSRYQKFCSTLATSPKFSIRYLTRIMEGDNSTVMGRTLSYISEECNVERDCVLHISSNYIKKSIKYCILKDDENWKVEIGRELIELRDRHGSAVIPGFDHIELNEMLDYICTN